MPSLPALVIPNRTTKKYSEVVAWLKVVPPQNDMAAEGQKIFSQLSSMSSTSRQVKTALENACAEMLLTN